jgi:hypothetical protein
VSERRVCGVLGQPRATQRYQAREPADEKGLTAAIMGYATQYGRYGYRHITALSWEFLIARMAGSRDLVYHDQAQDLLPIIDVITWVVYLCNASRSFYFIMAKSVVPGRISHPRGKMASETIMPMDNKLWWAQLDLNPFNLVNESEVSLRPDDIFSRWRQTF